MQHCCANPRQIASDYLLMQGSIVFCSTITCEYIVYSASYSNNASTRTVCVLPKTRLTWFTLFPVSNSDDQQALSTTGSNRPAHTFNFHQRIDGRQAKPTMSHNFLILPPLQQLVQLCKAAH